MSSGDARRAVYNLDREMRFVSANDTALRYWKKTGAELIGRRMQDAFPQVVGSAPYEAHLHTLRSFRPFRGILTSPVLAKSIDLEIHPSADGVRVSFLKLER